jgi:hypothetical protein
MKQTDTIEFPLHPTTRRADLLWTSGDLATFLQVSLRWVQKQRALGVMPCIALPGRRLVRYDPEAPSRHGSRRAA